MYHRSTLQAQRWTYINIDAAHLPPRCRLCKSSCPRTEGAGVERIQSGGEQHTGEVMQQRRCVWLQAEVYINTELM